MIDKNLFKFIIYNINQQLIIKKTLADAINRGMRGISFTNEKQ